MQIDVHVHLSWNLFAIRISILVRDTVFHVRLESKQQLKMDEIFFQEKWTKYPIRLEAIRQVLLSVKYYLVHILIDWHITQEDTSIICLHLQGSATPMLRLRP
jgi:hypothetical protein